MTTATISNNEQSSELTAEQIEAITTTESSLVVSAAAGSGKTRVLVERYLRHVINEKYGADQILTITFTRKAAAEMKRRIVDRLAQAGLVTEAQIAETGPIQTIHGFCERLLRENAIWAGLDPEFEVLAEADAERILQASIEEVLASADDDDSEAAKLIRKIAGRRAYGESMNPHARLENAIRQTVKEWRGIGISVKELSDLHRNPVALLAKWRDAVLEEAPNEVRALYEADTDQENFAAKLSKAYRAARKAKPRYLRTVIDADLQCAHEACGLIELCCDAWMRFERKLRSLQRLDFTSLEAAAVELVRSSPELRKNLRAKYPIVLIDEAQDLNPIQHRLLNAMAPEMEMFVGDPQQSIYGFRQADMKLFQEKLSAGFGMRLSKNHRSDRGVLAFIDHLFGELWTDAYEPMAIRGIPQEGIELWVQRQRDVQLTASWIGELVQEQVLQGGSPGDIGVLVRNSEYANKLLPELTELGIAARITGGSEKFYTRLEVRDLANVLEALTDTSDDYALASVLRSPFVGLSLDALILLSEQRRLKKISLASCLRELEDLTPDDQEKLSRFQEWFFALSANADRQAAWEIIGGLFAQSPYLENLARREQAMQRLANVRKLLTLAAGEPELGPREYARRIRDIQTIRHKEGDAPAGDEQSDQVTIMTIHKSKGLEFPVVVVPDTHQKLTKPARDIEIDSDLKFVTVKFDRVSSMFHEWLASRRQEREEAEEWRVAYVAMTRAKKKLCLVVNRGGAGDRLADKIGRLLKLKDSVPEGIVLREATNLER